MCGIVGKISFTQAEVSIEDVQSMSQALSHRGPDDSGVFLSRDKRVGLGHQRLAIIDLSPKGHQPMTFQSRYHIVFNGEIYNFQEIRSDLQNQGYQFQTESDTEVLLALYAHYGQDCVRHLRGMFAFALYDEQENILFCARDRVGKKPFKYYRDKNVFLFASELKAILTQPEYVKKPDYVAIHHFLTLQYVPAPLTGFQGIKKLEPAHTLTINLRTGQETKECYWKLDLSKREKLNEKEWKEKIKEALTESVKLRMISDVPIGAFLSGGIDSSAIVALMSRASEKPIKTFSIGFSEDKFNELPYARMIAEKYKTDHTEFVVRPDAINTLPLLVRHYEEPFSDSSALPTYLLSKLTREHVTVALNGDGGDENFAGYGRYSVLKFSIFFEPLGRLFSFFLTPLTRILAQHFQTTLFDRISRFTESWKETAAKRYVNYLCYFTNDMKEEMYSERMKQKTRGVDSYDIIASQFSNSGAKNTVEQAVYADFMTYLPGALLQKVDIASMAASLECRSPFLDHTFLELTARIPFSLKLKGFNNKKYILKEAFRDIVPDEILFRPKMGFSVPIHDWLRADLKKYAHDLLLSEKALSRNLFKKEALENLLDTHCSTKQDYGYQIWTLITLELWFQEYFD